MSKLKGFVAACALALTVSALLAGVCTGTARAGGASQIAFADAQHGWQTTLEGSRAVIWRTVNGGASWTRLQSVPAGNGVMDGYAPGAGRLAFASRTVGVWFWYGRGESGSRAMLRTTDGGRSWKKCRVDVPTLDSRMLTDVSFASSKVGWACTQGEVGVGGSIAKTSNAGATWQVQKRLSVRAPGPWRVSCPTASSCYVLGLQYPAGYLWATADGGRHWIQRKMPRGTYWTSISFPTATNGWAVGPGESHGSVIRTRNGGRTWSYYRSGIAFYGISFCDPKVGFAVGAYGMVSRTTNGGSKWTDLEGPDPNGADLSKVTCVDATHVWVTDVNGNTYVSADGGGTWNWNSVYPPPTDPGE